MLSYNLPPSQLFCQTHFCFLQIFFHNTCQNHGHSNQNCGNEFEVRSRVDIRKAEVLVVLNSSWQLATGRAILRLLQDHSIQGTMPPRNRRTSLYAFRESQAFLEKYQIWATWRFRLLHVLFCFYRTNATFRTVSYWNRTIVCLCSRCLEFSRESINLPVSPPPLSPPSRLVVMSHVVLWQRWYCLLRWMSGIISNRYGKRLCRGSDVTDD